ncbi:hypothetical protein D3C72_1044640 [compost metagenome]
MACQGHDQHHHRHAGVRGPGECGRQQHGGHRLGGQRVENHAQHGSRLEGLEKLDQLMQGQQQQPQTDEYPAQVARAAGRVTAKHPDAGKNKNRGKRGQVERQQLHDQRGADVGAQHRGQCRHQAHHAARREAGNHQARGRAALQGGGNAQARRESTQAGAQGSAQRGAQGGAEGALDTGLDHVHAPEEQGDVAGEVKQGDKTRHPGVFPFFL